MGGCIYRAAECFCCAQPRSPDRNEGVYVSLDPLRAISRVGDPQPVEEEVDDSVAHRVTHDDHHLSRFGDHRSNRIPQPREIAIPPFEDVIR